MFETGRILAFSPFFVAHSKADFFVMRATMDERTTPYGPEVKPTRTQKIPTPQVAWL